MAISGAHQIAIDTSPRTCILLLRLIAADIIGVVSIVGAAVRVVGISVVVIIV